MDGSNVVHYLVSSSPKRTLVRYNFHRKKTQFSSQNIVRHCTNIHRVKNCFFGIWKHVKNMCVFEENFIFIVVHTMYLKIIKICWVSNLQKKNINISKYFFLGDRLVSMGYCRNTLVLLQMG